MNKKLAFILDVLACAALFLAPVFAVYGSNPQKVLRIMVSEGSSGRAISQAARDYEAAKGVKVEVLSYPYGDMHDKQLLELRNRSKNVDIVNVDSQIWLAELNGYLQPLKPYIQKTKFDTGIYVPSMLNMFTMSVHKEKTLLALPMRVGGWVLIYRTDLFKAKNLAVPKTTDEFLSVAQKLTEGNVYGFAAAFKQTNYLVAQWDPFLYSFGGNILNDKMTKAAFNSPQGKKATQFLVDLYRKYKVVPPSAIDYEQDGVISSMQQGITAMAITYSPYFPEINDPKKSKFSGNFAVAPVLPYDKDSGLNSGVTEVSGWGFGISKYSANKDLAWDLIKFVCGEAEQKKLAVENHNSPTVSQAFKDPEYLKVYPEATAVLTSLQGAKSRPGTIKWTRIEDALSKGLSTAITGEKTVDKMLADTEKEVNAILAVH
ncbi:MAG TPA: hypothetical protein DDW50_13320 [Firmicutes bacterium]|jgi:multiple sugar transport system substrate-binding protein|nr:hypothetical protein [Bacillota bacterium]